MPHAADLQDRFRPARAWYGACPCCGGVALYGLDERGLTSACCANAPCWWSAHSRTGEGPRGWMQASLKRAVAAG